MEYRRIILVLVALTALMVGCSSSSDPSDTGPSYSACTHPDSLVENFILAWEEMDIDGYRDHVIYQHEERGAVEEAIAEFKFYFIIDSFDDPFWGYDDESEHTEALFSGDPGENETPGMESISLHLTQMSSWTEIDEGTLVQDDPAPAGTQFKALITSMTLNLKGTMPGGMINAFLVDDVIQFYVIPVDVNGSTEYRLWKWMDVGNGKASMDCSWGAVKALY